MKPRITEGRVVSFGTDPVREFLLPHRSPTLNQARGRAYCLIERKQRPIWITLGEMKGVTT